MAGEAPTQWEPVLVRLSDVLPEEVNFLWHPYVPLGKNTLLEGDPGLGKTFTALELAAAVTLGRRLPGPLGQSGEPRAPANVVYLTVEDGLGDTLRPRLDAAGADSSRIYTITAKRTVYADGESVDAAVTLADIPVLESVVQRVRPVLVVLDPLQGYLPANVDMNRANETRPVMSAFGDLAAKYGFASVIIRHLRKSTSDRAVHRGLGSIDFAALARSILLVGEDPEDNRRRVLAHVKSSLAEPGPSLGFELRDGGLHWLGHSTVTADQLLSPRQSGDERSTEDEAAEWLTDLLAGGPVPARDVKRAAGDAGLSWRTVERAKARLGVRALRQSSGNTGAGTWIWSPKTVTAVDADGDGLAGLAGNSVTDATPARPPLSGLAVLPGSRPSQHIPQGRKTATASLEDRATAKAPDIASANLEALRHRYEAAATALGGSIPAWWGATARTEPQAVTLAVELVAEDLRAGAVSGQVHAYLAAARNALGGNQ